jgi:hypothetical protein
VTRLRCALASASRVLAIGVVARGALHNAAAACALRWLRGWPQDATGSGEPLVVLLPAFREQSVMEETLRHFAGLDYERDAYRILVVTSAREAAQRAELERTLPAYAERVFAQLSCGGSRPSMDLLTGHLPGTALEALWRERDALRTPADVERAVRERFAATPTTAEVARDCARRLNAEAGVDLVAHAEYAGPEPYKVGQVRWALHRLPELLRGWDRVGDVRYAGIYDIDARPRPETLRAVTRAARDRPAAIQQVALTLPRAAPGAPLGSRVFSLADALAHTGRSLSVEAFGLLHDRWVERHFRGLARQVLRPAVYTVGIGLFVDVRALPAVGGLPPVVDDVGFGWRVAHSGRRVEPLRVPVRYDAYETLARSVASRSFVYRAYLQFVGDYRAVPARRAGSAVTLLKVLRRGLEWPFGGPLATAAMLGAAARPRAGASLAAAALLNRVVAAGLALSAWRAAGFAARVPRRELAAAVAAAPAQVWWRGTGPRRLIRSRLLGRAAEPATKTER